MSFAAECVNIRTGASPLAALLVSFLCLLLPQFFLPCLQPRSIALCSALRHFILCHSLSATSTAPSLFVTLTVPPPHRLPSPATSRQTVTLRNPMVNDAYTNELVRLPLLWDSPTARVTSLGSAVQHQVAPLSPAPQHAGKFAVWVAASLGPLANQTFTIDSAGEARHGRGQAPFALPPRHPALRPHSAPATDTGPVPAAQQREAAGFSDAASVTRTSDSSR